MAAAAALAARLRALSPPHYDELVAILVLAVPVVATYLLSFLQAVVAQILVGHVSAEALAAATLANMLANALGNSLVIGCSSACDTLCSQAYGAKNLARVGHVTQRGIAVGLVMCIPIAIVWLFAEPMLLGLGQDPTVASLAGGYIRWLLVGLPALGTFEVLKKHVTNVGAPALPLVITGLATFLNIGVGYVLVFETPLGFYGAPIAISVSYVAMLGMMLGYFHFHRPLHSFMRAWGLAWLVPRANSAGAAAPTVAAESPAKSNGVAESDKASAEAVGVSILADSAAAEDWGTLSAPASASSPAPAAFADQPVPATAVAAAQLDFDDVLDLTLPNFSAHIAFSGWREYLALGLPSAAALFSEWASYEATSIIAGLISVDSLATHSILATTASLSFMTILGIGVAVLVRIGNHIGGRRVQEAKIAYHVAMWLWLLYAALNAAVLLLVAPVWGRVFTDDAIVDARVTSILWVLAAYGVFDTGQCILSFVFRALGRPGLAAGANVLGYMVVGLPLGYTFAIVLKLDVLGIWVAYMAAVTLVFFLLLAMLQRIDWQKESELAFARASAEGPDGAKAANADGATPAA